MATSTTSPFSERHLATFERDAVDILDQFPNLEDPHASHRSLVALAQAAGNLIQLDWGLGLPHPDISRRLWHVVCQESTIAQRLARAAFDDGLGCWRFPLKREYTGEGVSRYPTGTCVAIGAKGVGMHRIIYRLTFAVNDFLESLDHLCRVHACSNPLHLDPVTHKVNVRRGVIARRPTPLPGMGSYDLIGE